MKDFFKKILEGNKPEPSESYIQSFNELFADAINVEWSDKEGYYEAIFYRNNLEHIARFNKEGKLLEYQQNISQEYLPERIKDLAFSKGEIMNAVLKNKGNTLEYEIIVRDKFLKRYLVIFNDIGEIKKERIL